MLMYDNRVVTKLYTKSRLAYVVMVVGCRLVRALWSLLLLPLLVNRHSWVGVAVLVPTGNILSIACLDVFFNSISLVVVILPASCLWVLHLTH